MAAWGCLAGCSMPAQRADFSSNDPQERTLAVAKAARDEDRRSVPQLIQVLQSTDPAERMLAIETLERITGQTLGFEYWAPAPARREAIERWQAWWRQESSLSHDETAGQDPGPESTRSAFQRPSP